MRLPTVQGVIDRRILVNYRVDPEVVAKLLPAPFRPQLVNGFSIAGICLIRLKHLRPKYLPAAVGIGSENVAHRIAVEWDENGCPRHGVFIPRRDTNSRLNTLLGGWMFPGEHHHAKFEVDETDDRLNIAMHSDDDHTHLHVKACVDDCLPATSIFSSLQAVSDFFAGGSLGYSATSNSQRFDALELCCQSWHVTPLNVAQVESSFFDDRSLFPAGSIQFDCALLMRGIEHQWHSRPGMCCTSAANA